MRDEAERPDARRRRIRLQRRDRRDRVDLGGVQIEDEKRRLQILRLGEHLLGVGREGDFDAKLLRCGADFRSEQKVVDRRKYRHLPIICQDWGPGTWDRGPRTGGSSLKSAMPFRI